MQSLGMFICSLVPYFLTLTPNKVPSKCDNSHTPCLLFCIWLLYVVSADGAQVEPASGVAGNVCASCAQSGAEDMQVAMASISPRPKKKSGKRSVCGGGGLAWHRGRCRWVALPNLNVPFLPLPVFQPSRIQNRPVKLSLLPADSEPVFACILLLEARPSRGSKRLLSI